MQQHSETSVSTSPTDSPALDSVTTLEALRRKVLWLSSWMIHNANNVRPARDGLKVGGHQASSASCVTLMTALYFRILKPEDRVAVKPHASPVFHAIQYLLGNQTRDKLEKFRAFGGAQSYPSRTKDTDDVDFSTGSVGLGVAMTSFSAMVRDYIATRVDDQQPPAGRMIAIVGDAELDEGNVYEAMLEGWKQKLRNTWWIIDYNRQSLDAVVSDRLFNRFDRLFENMGWRVITIKYGMKQRAAFERKDGDALRDWIDSCPNDLYSALVFKGGQAWREHLLRDLADKSGVLELLEELDDAALEALMTNLGGHDMDAVIEAFESVKDDTPTCFIAYTIKGYGLPFAGHKDNHAGLMSPEQIDDLRARMEIPFGDEWDHFAGLGSMRGQLETFLKSVPFAAEKDRRRVSPRINVPARLPSPRGSELSTQDAFGRILAAIGRERSEFADSIVTTSPDVTVSTNLGGWVNRRGIYYRQTRTDNFDAENVKSLQEWKESPDGQHMELGIAENNLFILLAALGLSHSLFGKRLIPIGTVYDPFIERGLDALNYACYQDARFMLVATPSGITLAPEGGAHQSIATPMIGIAQPGLASFEPAFADELAVIMAWSFDYMQREGGALAGDLLNDAEGGSVYLRLSTRGLKQPEREVGDALAADIIRGAYWIRTPARDSRMIIAYTGAIAPEAHEAFSMIVEDFPDAGLLAVTSADRLHRGWQAAMGRRQSGGVHVASHVEQLMSVISPEARIVSVVDGHPGTLSWLGSVAGHRVYPLGVESFGQSADLIDLYRHYRIDTDAILDAVASACLGH